MSNNHPNHLIEWPECWNPSYTGPSLIGWGSKGPEDKRIQDLTYATKIAYEELTQLENNNVTQTF